MVLTRKSISWPRTGELDAPVLGEAALGDVEAGHDLDAGDDGGGEVGRRGFGFVEDAVVAVADAETVFEGLDVDVGREGLDGAGDEAVDEADDGGLGGEVFEAFSVFFEGFGGSRVGGRRRW